MDVGLVGGMIGGAIGVIGGIVGTYASINNTQGPKERQFMIRASAVAWIGIALFLVLLLTLPKPFNFLMWGVYGVLLPLGIIKTNKTVAAIREAESRAGNQET